LVLNLIDTGGMGELDNMTRKIQWGDKIMCKFFNKTVWKEFQRFKIVTM